MDTQELVLDAFSSHIRGIPVTVSDKLTDSLYASFVRETMRHKIFPMAVAPLLASGVLNEEQEACARTALKRLAVAQTYRVAAFRKLYRTLVEAGARPLCVKGAVCRALYPDPDMRVSGDEDLLVSEKDFSVCRAALLQAGFESSDSGEDFEVTFTDKASGLRIELHRSLFDPESEIFGDFNRFFDRAFDAPAEADVDDMTVYTLPEELHLLYLLLHAFKHFIHAGVGIRQLCDISLFAAKAPGAVPFVFEKSAQVNADGFFSAVLLVGERYFGLSTASFRNGCPLFDAGLDTAPLLNDIMSGGIYGADGDERQHSALITLRAVSASRNGKKTSLLRTLFPTRDSLRKRYPYLNDHPYLLPAAWTRRLLDYIRSGNNSSETLRTGERRIELLKKYRIIR